MRVSFGSWLLDTDRRLLLDDGEPVSLSPKAFELLRLLAEHHERAFSKAELHALLWPNTFVSDGSLTILVAEIRDVLKDDADRPRFIRTVRRFGYAFCAPVIRADAVHVVAGPHQSGWVIWGNKSIALAEGETILGRALDAHIRFDVPGVSRRHARIVVAAEHVRIADLDSQNGTYVGGKRVSGLATLSDGDEIHLGPVSIVFRLVSPDGSTFPMP
jgi:DNA-binding winged helix-turn-helix (wHTH) protein